MPKMDTAAQLYRCNKCRRGYDTWMDASGCERNDCYKATLETVEKRDTVAAVAEFHRAFELHDHTRGTPGVPTDKVCLVRTNALHEEVAELGRAMQNGDLPGVLDALTDIQYFLDGTYIACGMSHLKEAAFDEVHESNMSKLAEDGRPLREPGGRVIKGPNYFKPNLEKILEEDDGG